MENENTEKKEMSKEEAAKQLREDRMKNLESLALYAGSNFDSQGSLGEDGVQAGKFGFQGFLTSEIGQKIGQDAYARKVKEEQEVLARTGYQNTISAPEHYVSNREREIGALKLIDDSQRNLKLTDLAKVVNKINPNFKMDLPEEVGNLTYNEFMDKGYKNSPIGATATILYETAKNSYKSFAGINLLNQYTTAQANMAVEKVLEAYKAEKEKAAQSAQEAKKK